MLRAQEGQGLTENQSRTLSATAHCALGPNENSEGQAQTRRMPSCSVTFRCRKRRQESENARGEKIGFDMSRRVNNQPGVATTILGIRLSPLPACGCSGSRAECGFHSRQALFQEADLFLLGLNRGVLFLEFVEQPRIEQLIPD